MMWLKKIFCRKEKQEAKPLEVEGVPAVPVTPMPDKAELAAEALLESSASVPNKKKPVRKRNVKRSKEGSPSKSEVDHDTTYYKRVAERITAAHATEARLVMRYLAYVEQELMNHNGERWETGQVADIERGLYKRMGIVEREGGELKKRWQHCLADITLRMITND